MDPHIQSLKVKNIADEGNSKVLKASTAAICDDIEIRVIDYFHTFGAFIDRDYHSKLGMRRSLEQSRDNFGHYVLDPAQSTMDGQLPQKLTQNIQLLIEVRTKVKLDAVDRDGRGLIETKLEKEDEEREEVHYMMVENVMEEYDLGWKILLKPFMNMLKLSSQVRAALLMHTLKDGWVITDFDGCLNGNPRD